MNKFVIPLVIFVALLVLLVVGLSLDPRKIPSPFIGKPAPDFSIASLESESVLVDNKMLLGKAWVLNVWASWCVGCREEHHLIQQIAADSDLPIVGLNYKDTRIDANAWLNDYGNPYQYIAFDQKGDVGIDYGVYGVPETFVIDQKGIIQYKHIGPVTEIDLNDTIMPLIRTLQ